MSSIDKPSDFERGFELILNTFLKYASKGPDGSNDQLEKDEMADLIKKEFKGYLSMCSNTSVDEIFKKFDEDNSESVDFVEFLKIVAQLAADAKIVEKLAKSHQRK